MYRNGRQGIGEDDIKNAKKFIRDRKKDKEKKMRKAVAKTVKTINPEIMKIKELGHRMRGDRITKQRLTMPFRTKDTLLGQARSGNPYNLGIALQNNGMFNEKEALLSGDIITLMSMNNNNKDGRRNYLPPGPSQQHSDVSLQSPDVSMIEKQIPEKHRRKIFNDSPYQENERRGKGRNKRKVSDSSSEEEMYASERQRRKELEERKRRHEELRRSAHKHSGSKYKSSRNHASSSKYDKENNNRSKHGRTTDDSKRMDERKCSGSRQMTTENKSRHYSSKLSQRESRYKTGELEHGSTSRTHPGSRNLSRNRSGSRQTTPNEYRKKIVANPLPPLDFTQHIPLNLTNRKKNFAPDFPIDFSRSTPNQKQKDIDDSNNDKKKKKTVTELKNNIQEKTNISNKSKNEINLEKESSFKFLDPVENEEVENPKSIFDPDVSFGDKEQECEKPENYANEAESTEVQKVTKSPKDSACEEIESNVVQKITESPKDSTCKEVETPIDPSQVEKSLKEIESSTESKQAESRILENGEAPKIPTEPEPVPEIPKNNKLNEKTANLNQATIKNCDQVKDATKEAEKDDEKGPKAAEKDVKIEQKGTENDGNKGPKPAEKLKKDAKYLESLREKAKAAQKAKQEKIRKAIEDLSIEVKKCQQSKDSNYMNSTLQALRMSKPPATAIEKIKNTLQRPRDKQRERRIVNLESLKGNHDKTLGTSFKCRDFLKRLQDDPPARSRATNASSRTRRETYLNTLRQNGFSSDVNEPASPPPLEKIEAGNIENCRPNLKQRRRKQEELKFLTSTPRRGRSESPTSEDNQDRHKDSPVDTVSKVLESLKQTTDDHANDGQMLSGQASNRHFQPKFIQAQYSSGHINPQNAFQYAPNSVEQLNQYQKSSSVVYHQNQQQAYDSNTQQQFQLTPQKLFRQPQLVPQIESQHHCQVKDCHQIQPNYQQPQLNSSQQYQNLQIQHQQVLQPQLSQCYHQQDLLQQSHSNMQNLPFQQAYPKQCQSVSQSQIQYGCQMTQQQYQQQPQLLQSCPKDQHQQLGNVNDVQNAYPKQCQSGSQSQIQFGSQMTQQQHQQQPQLLQSCPKDQHQPIQSNSQCQYDTPFSHQCLNAYPKQYQSGSQYQIQYGSQMAYQQYQQPQLLQSCPKDQHQQIPQKQCLNNKHPQQLVYPKGPLQPRQIYLNDQQFQLPLPTQQMQPCQQSLNDQQFQPLYFKGPLQQQSQHNSQQPTQQYNQFYNPQQCQSFSENLKRLEDHIQPQHHQLSQQQPLIGQGNHQPPGQHVHLDHYNNQRTQFKSYQHYPHDHQHNRGESLPSAQISSQVSNDFNQQQQKLVAPTDGQLGYQNLSSLTSQQPQNLPQLTRDIQPSQIPPNQLNRHHQLQQFNSNMQEHFQNGRRQQQYYQGFQQNHIQGLPYRNQSENSIPQTLNYQHPGNKYVYHTGPVTMDKTTTESSQSIEIVVDRHQQQLSQQTNRIFSGQPQQPVPNYYSNQRRPMN